MDRVAKLPFFATFFHVLHGVMPTQTTKKKDLTFDDLPLCIDWSDIIYTTPPSLIMVIDLLRLVMDLLRAWHERVDGRFPHVYKDRHVFASSTSQTTSARKRENSSRVAFGYGFTRTQSSN